MSLAVSDVPGRKEEIASEQITTSLHAKSIQYQCRPNVANFTLHWNDIGTVFIYCIDESCGRASKRELHI